MRATAHLYLFSDGCPSDWLECGQEDRWHTIANFVFQSAHNLQGRIEAGVPHQEILESDEHYQALIQNLQSRLRSGQLKKWGTRGRYRSDFCRAFTDAIATNPPIVSACSFQEKVLRNSWEALQGSYNDLIGGVEGRGIGFTRWFDDEGRPRMKHSFVDMDGHHEIRGLENQILVVLLMSWFIADQYRYYRNDIISGGRYGFDRLEMTVVSDKLSGDDDSRRNNERNLRHLIDPEGDNGPIVLTRSPDSDSFSGDLLADNLAGWLNAAVTNPSGDFGDDARDVADSNVWSGWHVLEPSETKLESTPAMARLAGG